MSTLSPEQRALIADFKKKVIARARSATPLSVNEKSVMAVSISTTTKSIPNMIIVDQSVLQFSAEELQIIFKSLSR